MTPTLGITVVELPTFAADARRLLTDQELHELIDRLAYDPEQGVLIPARAASGRPAWVSAGAASEVAAG
jgi:hypothetical protein